MEDSEIWLPAPGLEDRYEVSNIGRVRHVGTGNHPTLQRCDRGYVWLKYYRVERGYCDKASVARLVCGAFNEPAPAPDSDVDHINRVRDENVPENLRWVTRAENLSNRVCAAGEKHPHAKLTVETVRLIRSSQKSNIELAAALGVSRRTISDARRLITWSHVNG